MLKMLDEIMNVFLQRSPLVLILCVISYVMYTYLQKRDATIKEKDELIIQQTERLMVLYGNAVESQKRLSTVIEELRKDIERLNYK
jgi:hypothetical protein